MGEKEGGEEEEGGSREWGSGLRVSLIRFGYGRARREECKWMRDTNTDEVGLFIGTPILVPLTPSLYVPGKLASTDVVLVDIGTGFYVEKVCLTITWILEKEC